MNVTFHALLGITTGITLTSALPAGETTTCLEERDVPILLGSLALNVLLHGILDILPHTYPIPWWLDLPLSTLLFFLILTVVRRRNYLLLAVSFLGAMLPDLVDQSFPLLNHLLHLDLPTWEIFPWHWSRYSGAMYGAVPIWLAVLDHGLVLAVCAGLFLARRRRLVHIWRT